MELALAIISIIVGLVSIVLAIVSMITTSRTEKRIIKIVKNKFFIKLAVFYEIYENK